MAKCKNCGADIPDWKEYCESCEKEQVNNKKEESYLDDLLNSIMTDNASENNNADAKKETYFSELENLTDFTEDFKADVASNQQEVEMETAFPELMGEEAFSVPDITGMEDIFAQMSEQSEEEMPLNDTADFSGLEDIFANPEIPFPEKEEKKESELEDLFGIAPSEEAPDWSDMENLFGTDVGEQTSIEELPNLAGMDDLFAAEPETPPLDISGMEDLFEPKKEVSLDDIFAIPEVSSSNSTSSENATNPLDGDMFSIDNLLGATEELPDEFFVEMEPPKEEQPKKKEKKAKTQKEKKHSEKEEKPKKENELYNKLFKNVPLDPSQIKEDPTPEEIAAKKKEKADKKAKEKEEKKALAEQKKAEAQRKKEEKKRLAADKKEEKKARKLEEAKLVLEEIQKTRINKVGASLVFSLFLIIALVIIIGTNMASYSIAIRHAEAEFERKRYNDAYEEVYGIKVEPEEQLLYDKIMTVMYVQKQLNSYNNFMTMGEDAKALDSLVKGLQRYEKYMYLADELGITADFDYVRGQLLEAVNRNFGLAEEETDKLVTLYNEGQKVGSQIDYSAAIYDAIHSETETNE